MKLTHEEKRILYTWGCPVYKNTITRLAYAAAFMTDIDAKHSIAMFRDKLILAEEGSWFEQLYRQIRKELAPTTATLTVAA